MENKQRIAKKKRTIKPEVCEIERALKKKQENAKRRDRKRCEYNRIKEMDYWYSLNSWG